MVASITAALEWGKLQAQIQWLSVSEPLEFSFRQYILSLSVKCLVTGFGTAIQMFYGGNLSLKYCTSAEKYKFV